MKKKNLKLLAEYLLSLPEDYERFNMGAYFSTTEEYEGALSFFDDGPHDFYIEVAKTKNTCGTVACAVGHLPLIKGLPKPKFEEDWRTYSERVTGIKSDIPWRWCFDGGWENTDNTHYGAAKRILYLIDHGTEPEWFLDVGDARNWEEKYDAIIASYTTN